MKYAIIRDRTMGGTPVWDIAMLGRKIDAGGNGMYPRYSVTLLDGKGRLRKGETYERFVNPAEIFPDFNSACSSPLCVPML